MELVPEPPLTPHIWVWAEWPPRGQPAPGVTMGWHLSPERSTRSPWLVQVALQRAAGTVTVNWVAAQRVAAVRDSRPGGPRRGVRHIWVRRSTTEVTLEPAAGLLIDWRRTETGWEALTATAQDTSLLVSWQPAEAVAPIVDDSWTAPEVVRYKRG